MAPHSKPVQAQPGDNTTVSKSPATSRIGMGGAQLGMPYGISNDLQVPTAEAVRDMLQLAAAEGLRVIDTAPLYGASEDSLGRALWDRHPFDIVTKTLPLRKACLQAEDAVLLKSTFYRSLERLRQPSLYGLLIHDAQDLLQDGSPIIYDAMCGLKAEGLVRRIGVSVYTPFDAEEVVKRFPIDIVQAPLNAFDQRLVTTGCLARLKARGVEVHSRSAFLQGLLLMEPEALNDRMAGVRPLLRRWHSHIEAHGISPLLAAIAFVMRQGIDCCVIGTCSREQLSEVLRASHTAATLSMSFAEFACEDERFINPALWVQA